MITIIIALLLNTFSLHTPFKFYFNFTASLAALHVAPSWSANFTTCLRVTRGIWWLGDARVPQGRVVSLLTPIIIGAAEPESDFLKLARYLNQI